MQSDSKLTNQASAQFSRLHPHSPPPMLSYALEITDILVPAVCMDCVFELCVWLVNMQSTLNQVVLGHKAVISLTGSQV